MKLCTTVSHDVEITLACILWLSDLRMPDIKAGCQGFHESIMCRVSSTDDEASSEISSSLDMAPLEELSPSVHNTDSRPVSCKLEANGGISMLDQSMGWKVNKLVCALFAMHKLIASSYVLIQI